MPFLSQMSSGLAAGSQLFLVAAGLTLIIGVSRTANLSLGAQALLAAEITRNILARLPLDWVSTMVGILAAVIATAAIGALLDFLVLRRLRRAPILFSLVATLGIALFIDGLLPSGSAPGPMRAILPVQIASGPIVLVLLLVLLRRTPWGATIRATREDRELAAALGVNPRWLQTSVAALGAGLAGLAGALLALGGPIGPASDLDLLTGSLVVVIIGGLGSVGGAFVAAIMVGLAQAVGTAVMPHAALVPAAAVLAVILLVRPRGLFGPGVADRPFAHPALVRRTPTSARLLGLALLLAIAAPFLLAPDLLAILSQVLIALLFTASLHLLLGPGGMPSLGHAAFFGIGAYAAAALISSDAGLSVALISAPLAAGAVAFLLGMLLTRLPGVALAMVTLIFAQLFLTVARPDASWIARPLPAWSRDPVLAYWLVLALCTAIALLLRRVLSAPFGYALRAARDDPRRALAIGIPVGAIRLAAFTLAGSAAGMAGGLTTAQTGRVVPAELGLGTSLDGVLMVVLGGLQTLSGPIVGALAVTGLQQAARSAAFTWQPLLGFGLVAVVLLLPEGIAGASVRHWRRAR